MKKAYRDRDNARGVHATLAWLIEEVGELAEAVLKGRREGVAEEVADVIAWVISIANLFDVDVVEALARKYNRELKGVGCIKSS